MQRSGLAAKKLTASTKSTPRKLRPIPYDHRPYSAKGPYLLDSMQRCRSCGSARPARVATCKARYRRCCLLSSELHARFAPHAIVTELHKLQELQAVAYGGVALRLQLTASRGSQGSRHPSSCMEFCIAEARASSSSIARMNPLLTLTAQSA